MPKDSYASGPSSNPSSKSYSGGGGGGGVSTGKSTGSKSSGDMRGASPLAGLANARPTTGITTGKTIYGNTAFGPSGGNATGYATRNGNISGMGPSMTTFSNFRTPSGGAMFSGQAGNTPVTARNAQQAAGMLAAMQRAQAGAGRSGMLSGDPMAPTPVPQMRPRPVGVPIPPELQLSIPPAPGYLPEQSMRPRPYTRPQSYPYTFGPRVPGNWPTYDGGYMASGAYGNSALTNPSLGYGNASLGAYDQRSTPKAWNDFSDSVSNFLGGMRAR